MEGSDLWYFGEILDILGVCCFFETKQVHNRAAFLSINGSRSFFFPETFFLMSVDNAFWCSILQIYTLF